MGQYTLQVLCSIIATASASVKYGVYQLAGMARRLSYCSCIDNLICYLQFTVLSVCFGMCMVDRPLAPAWWHVPASASDQGLLIIPCCAVNVRIHMHRAGCHASSEPHGLRPLGRSRQQGRDDSTCVVNFFFIATHTPASAPSSSSRLSGRSLHPLHHRMETQL